MAISHARRAIYDAYDVCVVYYLRMCADFDKEYKKIPITAIYPQYIIDIKTINSIKEKIEKENRKEKNFF